MRSLHNIFASRRKNNAELFKKINNISEKMSAALDLEPPEGYNTIRKL